MKFRADKTRLLTLFCIMPLGVYASAQEAQKSANGCLNYEPETVALHGKLKCRAFTNASGEREVQYLLKLGRPICLNADPQHEYNREQREVVELQLVVLPESSDKARSLLDCQVVVNGRLFGAHNTISPKCCSL